MKKKVSKSALIRKLIDDGLSDIEIVRKLKVSAQLAYQVRKNYKAKATKVSSAPKYGSDDAEVILGWLTRSLQREPLILSFQVIVPAIEPSAK